MDQINLIEGVTRKTIKNKNGPKLFISAAN